MRRLLRNKLHVSWFIAWASFGFLVGVALSVMHFSSFFAVNSWLIFCLSIFFIVVLKRWSFLILFAVIAGVIFGLWRGGIERQALTSYRPFIGKVITLSGSVAEDTSFGPKGDQRIMVANVRINGKPMPEEVWLSSSSTLEIKRGDNVSFKGFLNKGFGNIPASMFKAKLVSENRPDYGNTAVILRDNFARSIKKSIPAPESGLGIGYLLGQRSSLPENFDNNLKTVGLTHAVVASGYNLTILVAFASSIFIKKSKYLTAISGGLLICGFILMTGFSPSMSRAGLVSGLSLLAWYYGRKIHPLVLLPFAAAITVLIHPAYIWGDIGWYLSFMAFIGVIIIAPLINHYFWGAQKNPHFIRELFVATFAAQLATAPIILYTFHQFSKYALLANLLVLPLVPIAMLFTFLAGIASLLAPTLAGFFGLPAYATLNYSMQVVNKIAGLTGAKTDVNFGLKSLIISYVLFVFIFGYIWYTTRHSFRQNKADEFSRIQGASLSNLRANSQTQLRNPAL